MRAWAYYNEIDPFAAEQLRVHMAAGRIMPGVVDERSIEDVRPDDLRGFTQVNFFAGIGVWSYALRRAGWLAGRATSMDRLLPMPTFQRGRQRKRV